MTFTLANDSLSLRIERAGAEIRSIVHAQAGELLFKLDSSERGAPAVPGVAVVDPSIAWLEDYHGGWQVLFPNVGAACEVGCTSHQYHGDSSRVLWDVVGGGSDQLTMRCELPHGIDAVRTVALTSAPTGVRIMTHLTTRRDSDVHFLYAEHPAFPLTPDMEVSLSVPVETHPAPARPSPDFSTTLGGRHDELDLTPIDLGAARDRFSECVSVIRVRHPVAAVTWPSRGVGIRLSWDGTLCPYALLWAQNGVERYPFAGGPGCVAIEPSTVSALGGLAAAIEGGTSSVLSPKQTLTAQIDFTVHETAPPQSG